MADSDNITCLPATLRDLHIAGAPAETTDPALVAVAKWWELEKALDGSQDTAKEDELCNQHSVAMNTLANAPATTLAGMRAKLLVFGYVEQLSAGTDIDARPHQEDKLLISLLRDADTLTGVGAQGDVA